MKQYLKRVNLIFKDYERFSLMMKIESTAPKAILDSIERSALRGRGGAGFPTGQKWRLSAEAEGSPKVVICNADEGEPGTFKDREILERRSDRVLSGIQAAARAVGARTGIIYLRGEYSALKPKLLKEITLFNRELRSLGSNLSISLFCGSGAYICGEETALLESLEGHRGEARNKPPYPAIEGYKGRPTVINNVETLVYASIILEQGSDVFLALGTDASRGAKLFCVSGDTPSPGIYEFEMGMNLQQFVDEFGDGDTKAVQVGGFSGYCVPRKRFADTTIGFEGIPTGGSMMLFNSSRSMYKVLQNYLDFFIKESCGQCTPCRAGCIQLQMGIEAIRNGTHSSRELERLLELADTIEITSKCGLGQSVIHPFRSIITHFREEIVY